MRQSETHSTIFSLFSLLFLSLYFLLLFLVENKYILWMIPPLTLLYLVTIFYKTWKNHREADRINMLISSGVCLYVCLLFGLSFLSISIPLSLHRWVTLGLGGLTFATFFGAPHLSKSLTNTVILGTALIHLLFVALGILFLFFKAPLSFLPANSLLTFLVGQNHAYILYLYSLPITIYYWMKSNYRWQWAAVNLAFVIGVITSFSRFGIGLLAVELLLFWQLFLSTDHKLSKRVRNLLFAVFGVIVTYGAALFIFSSIPHLSFGDNCKAPLLSTQICKSFVADQRLAYWNQALRGFLDHPLIGNGGNTFELISKKYAQKSNQYSSYAHNEYLQLLAEYGVFGAGIIFFYMVVLWWSIRQWKTATQFTKTLLISLGILSIDGVINFNMSYTAIFMLQCLLISIVLRNLREKQVKSNHSQKSFATFSFLISVTLLSLPIFWFTGKLAAAELFFKDNIELYMNLFPHTQEHAVQAYRSGSVSDKTKQKVKELYKNDPVIVKLIVGENHQPEDQLVLYQRYLSIDTLNIDTRAKLISLATHLNKPDIVLENLNWFVDYYPYYEKHQIRNLDYVYLEKTIGLANKLAAEDPELAKKITLAAYHFEPWRVNEVSTVFLLEPEKFNVEDVNAVLEVVPKDAWYYQEPLGEWVLKQAAQSAQDEDWQSLQKYAELCAQLNESRMYPLWESLFPIFEQKISSLDLSKESDSQKRSTLLKSWRDTLASIKKFDTVGFATSEWSKQIDAFE